MDYPLNPNPRYELDRTPHPSLLALLAKNREHYQALLTRFSTFSERLARIPQLPSTIALPPGEHRRIPDLYTRAVNGDQEAVAWFEPIVAAVAHDSSPCWLNGFIPGLDGVALYCFVAINNPRLYLEVGSGNSTKFVRQAISDYQLSTRIISIDPQPRASIDGICDQIIREPLEQCPLSVFEGLGGNDILFVDGSHRCFMNSDTTVFFLEVLPSLSPEVLVGIHDIFLPYDYPRTWASLGYSEQYLLAASLLAGPERFRIELPALYVSSNQTLKPALGNIAAQVPNIVSMRGTAFWFRTVP